VDEPHTRRCRRFEECGVQRCPAHSASGAGPKWCVDATVALHVGDAAKWLALHCNPEAVQLLDSMWHQPLTAGLVDGSASPLDDNNLEARPGAVQCGGQSGRATPADQQINHVSLASASFSTLIRVRSSAAFSTVNTMAVIHAVCTIGSATPSKTTAT
jgi:hypothetical protein